MTLFASETTAWPFRTGDIWCAVGDSITQSGLYHRDVYLFHVTRFPERRIRHLNRGVAGDTATGGLRRLEHDILSPVPSVVTLMFGMNDVTRFAYRGDHADPVLRQQREFGIAGCLRNLRQLSGDIDAAGARVVFLTPSIFDQSAVFPGGDNVDAVGLEAEGVNTGLGRIAEGVRTLAAEQGAPVVDFHAAMSRLNAEAQKEDPAFTLVGPDRVHPGGEGHFFMTRVFLEAFNAPGLVSSVEVDAGERSGTVLKGVLEGLEFFPEGLSFTFHARALPFPLEESLRDTSAFEGFQHRFNQELLRVRGLDPRRYRLSIDGIPVGVFSARALEEGINLADSPVTPQYQQALEVRERIRRRHQLISERIRGLMYVEHGYLNDAGITEGDLPGIRKVLAEKLETIRGEPWFDYVNSQFENYAADKAREPDMLREADELEDAIWEAARPLPRRYRIEAVDE